MVVTIDVKHLYRYPVEYVAHTHFSKYPTAKEKFVKRVEVVEQNSDANLGIHFRRSIAVCDNVIPGIFRSAVSILNENAILLEERAWLNKQQRQLKLESNNITWAKYANMTEESVFRSSEENPSWTVFEQHGMIHIKGLGPFGRVIEMFAERFLHAGVKRSLNIMEDLLQCRYGKPKNS